MKVRRRFSDKWIGPPGWRQYLRFPDRSCSLTRAYSLWFNCRLVSYTIVVHWITCAWRTEWVVLCSRSAWINRNSAGGPVNWRPETRSGIIRSVTSTREIRCQHCERLEVIGDLEWRTVEISLILNDLKWTNILVQLLEKDDFLKFLFTWNKRYNEELLFDNCTGSLY